MPRNLYLTNTPVEEALDRYLVTLKPLLKPRFEVIPVTAALGRVTKDAVFAVCCSPLFNAAAMDGIAVLAAETAGASESAPVSLHLVKHAVELASQTRDFGTAVVVDTGDPIRDPWDAVIMAEDLVDSGNGDTVEIHEAAVSWQHIRPIGEDIVTGEMLLPGKHTIRPIDIGVLLSGGITRLEVYQKPRVAIFPTGTEIIEAGEKPGEGQIIESNTRMLEAMLIQGGGEASRFAPIPDDYERLRDAVKKAAADFDMVLVNAGSSAGTEDYTVHVLRELGEVIVHGVAMKPGKPVILAVVQGKPVIGIPGYPVSAYLAYENFAAPVLAILSGYKAQGMERAEAVIARRLVSSLKHREYVRVKVGRVDGKLVASPLARGAGAAMSLVRADGFCVIEQNCEGLEAGDKVSVDLYRSLPEIERTVVSIGSHDLILDIISDLMASRSSFMASTHVGSMAGLMALKRGECHIAPTHLLNEESGEYNISYLKQIFSGEPVMLIKGVGRVQGLIVKKGNPLGIQSIADLCRCRYINRQRGAGTRLLLDYRLKKEGIKAEHIHGYEREATTHMAVAAAVESGSADAGLGVSSAARALDLGFIPLGNEEYDFAILERFLELPHIQVFLETLRSEAFHQRLRELGTAAEAGDRGSPPQAYTWERCGELVTIL